MTEKLSGADENIIQGLSVVDSLSVPADNATQQTEDETDVFITEEEVRCLIKVEDDIDEVANDECRRENRVGVSECEMILEETQEEVAIALAEDKEEVKEVENTRKRTAQNSIHSSTLIITTEEHLDSTAFDDSMNNSEEIVAKPAKLSPILDLKINTNEEPCKKSIKPKPKKDDHNYFWVSNISRHVKATDLKKFFAQLGKVLTAKILTNGKSYFGYVSMDSAELAAKCIKQLNNTLFDSRKILVSKDRPDLRETKGPVKIEPRKKRTEKFDPKKSEKVIEPKVVAVQKVEPKEKKCAEEDISLKSNIAIVDLRRKLDRSKSEVSRLNWKLVEYQRRHDGMRKKCDSLERELKEMQFKMRNERRRLNQDREQFEKNKKLEQIRFEADRAIINKELDEVKKLREHLKEKIEEFKAQTKKAVKRRSRSPVVRVRSPRGRSPILRINNPNTGFRLDERAEKKRKRDEVSRGRTPPPPPKLSSVVGKKRGGDRGTENSAPNRPYFADVEKRPSCHEYDYRHKSSYVQPQEPSRSPWPTPYPKDPRRLNAGPSASQNYPVDMRYGGYQFPPSNMAAPPRNYYPEFGKPYGHF